jgi:hypothetical protein
LAEDIVTVLQQAIEQSNLIELLQRSDIPMLHSILEFANDHNLVNLLLHVTIWVMDRQELFPAFVFPESQILTPSQMLVFLIALKQTLISATRLCHEIDPALLFPSHILRRTDRRLLDDLCLVLEHQLQIGLSTMSLFDSSVNKTSIVARLFITNDFDRGFALARIFHVDIDEVMIEACAHIAQASEPELSRFLLGVIPRLELDSANRLIEALASILVRNKASGEFVARLVSGIPDARNVFQILRWFGSREHAAMLSFMCGFRPEIGELLKEARKRKDAALVRRSARWIRQFDGYS